MSLVTETFNYCVVVNGNWGDWAPWSKLCYCNHTQPRTRACNSPSPKFGGRYCPESTISFRSCVPDNNCMSTSNDSVQNIVCHILTAIVYEFRSCVPDTNCKSTSNDSVYTSVCHIPEKSHRSYMATTVPYYCTNALLHVLPLNTCQHTVIAILYQ